MAGARAVIRDQDRYVVLELLGEADVKAEEENT